MTEHKRYGDPQFGNTLDELKVLAPHAQTVDGVTFDGPAHKVGAILTLAGAAGELIADIERLQGLIEDLELALQDAEERAESAGRNASAFEGRMGDLQVENGKLRDSITARSDKLNEAQRIIEELRAEMSDLQRLPYTNGIGDAGEAYMQRFPYAHPLPAPFRWQELWEELVRAAMSAKGDGQ